MQGKLTSSQQFLTLVYPNQLQRTYRPVQSLYAQPTVWNYSSRQCEVLRQQLIMELADIHSQHSNRMNSRSPESILDIIVSSAWKPQLIPKESFESRDASFKVSDFKAYRYYVLFFSLRQQMYPQSAEPNTTEVIKRSLDFFKSDTNIKLQVGYESKQFHNSYMANAVEEGFLVFDSDWIQVSEEELLQNRQVYKKTSIFNPIKASELDPKDPQLLNKMFEPYVFETDGRFYRLNVSRRETSRSQLQDLEKAFEAKLVEKQARKSGICPIREQIHNQLFDQIIRQASVNLPERGILLMRVRDNLKMTFAAYQTLYQGSLVFGNRKAHVAELGISDLQEKIEKLRKKKIELQNQKILLQNELSAVHQGFREIKTIQQKTRNDQIVYLNEQTKRLEEYLNSIYGD